MTSRPFEDKWPNRENWIWQTRESSNHNAPHRQLQELTAGDQLPTRRTWSHPPEPSSCLSAGHYDRRHLAKGRVEQPSPHIEVTTASENRIRVRLVLMAGP